MGNDKISRIYQIQESDGDKRRHEKDEIDKKMT
jgi:hypothetical protein